MPTAKSHNRGAKLYLSTSRSPPIGFSTARRGPLVCKYRAIAVLDDGIKVLRRVAFELRLAIAEYGNIAFALVPYDTASIMLAIAKKAVSCLGSAKQPQHKLAVYWYTSTSTNREACVSLASQSFWLECIGYRVLPPTNTLVTNPSVRKEEFDPTAYLLAREAAYLLMRYARQRSGDWPRRYSSKQPHTQREPVTRAQLRDRDFCSETCTRGQYTRLFLEHFSERIQGSCTPEAITFQ
ncbi:hypothetical protein KCU78_g5, partial [Aureobasidium melanogenum]